MTKQSKTTELPADWKQKFKAASVKVGFQLNLSRSMLEYLCAVSDDVRWDRATFGDLHYPDNWIATQSSLEKRGLVESKSTAEREAAAQNNGNEITKAHRGEKDWADADMRNYVQLTPAGKALVALLKITGLFIVQDGALRRRRTA